MIIEYNGSIFCAAGFRAVTIRAEADRISAGMARVTKVTLINGEVPGYGMSRTGARRQEYNGHNVAQREIGARKRISSCTIIEEVTA